MLSLARFLIVAVAVILKMKLFLEIRIYTATHSQVAFTWLLLGNSNHAYSVDVRLYMITPCSHSQRYLCITLTSIFVVWSYLPTVLTHTYVVLAR